MMEKSGLVTRSLALGSVDPVAVRFEAKKTDVFSVDRSTKELKFKIIQEANKVTPDGQGLRTLKGAVYNRPAPVATDKHLTLFTQDKDGEISHTEWNVAANK
jgi:hypothetical protein